MARCTLDDLVPSFKCKRIFLEPLAGSFMEYKIQIEGSVYDAISDEDGIADYLLTDTFRENIKVRYFLQGGSNFKNFIDFLYSSQYHKTEFNPNGLSNAVKAMIVDFAIQFGSNGGDVYDYMLDDYHGTKDVLLGTVFQNAQFEQQFRALMDRAILGYQFDEDQYSTIYKSGVIDFSSYSNELLESHGKTTQDDQGNIIYELIIPRDAISLDVDEQFATGNEHIMRDVKTIYFYAVPYFDTDNLVEDVVIPLNSDTVEFFFKDTHICHILENSLPASPNVQDFRMSERISEIIRSDRISPYDNFIDNISLLSENENLKNTDSITKLFLSYQKELGLVGSFNAYVRGVYYINWFMLCAKNTKMKFVYENIYKVYIGLSWTNMTESLSQRLSEVVDNIIKSIQVIRYDFYRKRIDVKEDRVAISRDLSQFRLNEIGSLYSTNYTIDDAVNDALCTGYEFNDLSFRYLTYGTYTYELETEIIDPIYDYIEERIHKLKYGISVYRRMVEYIHNNAGNYNELRDELNVNAQSDLSKILNEPSIDGIEYNDWWFAMDDLFIMFGGVSYIADQQINLSLATTAEEALVEIENDPINPSTGVAYTDQEIQELKMALSAFQSTLMTNDPEDKFERRKIENQLRIMQDLMQGISKFFDIDSINSESSTTVQSQAEVIKLKKSWTAEASFKDLEHGFIRLAGYSELNDGFTEQAYEDRMRQEATLFSLENYYSNISDFGSITPIAIDGADLAPGDAGADDRLSLYGNLLEMGKVGIEEKEYYDSLISSGPTQGTTHAINSNDIKNNSGMFETFLANLGGTCENTTLSSMSTVAEGSSNNVYAKSVDDGENTRGERPSLFGITTEYSPQDDEENLSSDERNRLVREALVLEAKKKENIVLKMLAHPQGYGVLDRREYIQGEFQNSRYNPNFDFFAEVAATGKAYPSALASTAGERILVSAYNGVYSVSSNAQNLQILPFSRMVIDNTFIIYYLYGIDANMNPIWRHLVNFDIAKERFYNSHSNTGQRKLLCKFKRYRNSDLKIGQGSFSDRTILSEYFYLKL